MNQQQQQQQGNGGGQGQNGIQNQNPNLMQNPNGASPLGMMQVINQNMQGVQRQYQALQSQPDSPQKEASINGLKAQMAKLTQMRAQATQMWETASRNNQMQQQQGGGGGQAGMNPNPNLQQQQYQMAQQLGQDSQSNPMRAASGGGMQMGMGMGMGNQNQPGMIQSQQNQSSRPPNSNSSNPNQLFEVIRSFHASKGTEDGGANLAPFSAPSSANPNQLAQVDVAKLFTIVVGTVGSYAILDSTEPWNPSPNSSENHSTTKGWAQLALKLGFAIANGNTDPNSQIGSDTPRKMSEYYKTKLGGFEKVWLERGGAGKMLNNGGPQHQRSDSSSSNPPMNPLNPAASFPPQMQQQLQQLQQAVKSGQISQDQAKKAFSEMSKAFMVKQQQQGSNPNQPQPQQNQNQNQENQSTDPNSSNANQESSSKEKENSKESTSATANPANGEKKDSGNNQEVKNEPEPAPEVPVKRGRGRPRKRPREDTANSTISTPQEEANEEENKKPKRETPSVNADGNGDEEKDRLATSTPVQLQNPSFATPQQFQQAPPVQQDPPIPPSRPNPDPLHPMLSQPIPGFNPPPNVSIEQTLQSMKQKYAVLFPQMSYAVGVLKNQSSSVSQTQKDTAQNLIRTTQYLANTIKALEQQLKAGAGSSSNSIPGGSAAQNPLSAISALLPPPHPSLSSLSPSIQVPQATSDPSTYSIAYIPTIRDVRTYAGIDINGLEGFDWDSNRERNLFALNEREDLNDEYVKRVESTLFGLDQRTGLPGSEGKVERVGSIIRGRGKVPRGINELGTVDISNLILSLRSRLEVEVTHTLNTLLILTSGVGAPRNFRFLLEPCEDLLDELLDVFIENSWREEEELIVDPLEPQSQDDDDAIAEKEASNNKSQQGEHSQKDAKTPEKKVQDWLYQDWLEAAEEDEGEMRIWKRFDRSIGNSNLGGSSSSISAHQGTSGTSRNANTSHVDGEAEPDNRNPNDKSTSTPPLSTSTSATSSSSDLNESNPSLPISTSEYFSSLNKERSLNRKAAMALVILNIFLNASFVEENMVFFSRHSRFWNVLTSLLEEGEQDVEKWEKVKRNSLIKQKEHSPEQKKIEESSTKPKTVFTTSEHLRIRKDILSILSNLSDPVIPLSQKPRSTNLTIWRLLKSFLLDDTRLEDPTSRNVYSSPNSQSSAIPAGAILPMTVTKAKVPYYSDLSFQAFSRLAQPDPNREVLSTLLTDKEVIEFSMTSLRRLPFDPSELMLLVSESWHAHCMRILLSIHSLIFLSNQNLKRKIRKSLNHVLPVTLTRLMRQLAAAYNNEFSQNNFRDLVIIIVEILKVVDQCTDTLGDVPSLLFGNQDIDEKEEKSKRNLPAILVGLEEEVKKILNITNLYPKIAYDLQQMLAF